MDKTEAKTPFEKKYVGACLNGDIETVRHMLKYENKNLKTRIMLSNCLEMACLGKHVDIVNLILSYRSISICNDDALVYACMGGSVEIINIINDICVGINTAEGMGKLWSHSIIGAYECGHMDIIKMYTKNVQVNYVDYWRDIKFWDLCLEYACASGNMLVVNYAIDNGATDFNLGLSAACEHGHAKIVKRMIKKGANIRDRSSIYSACEAGHIEIVKLLEKLGRCKGGNDVNWESAMSGACSGGHMDIVKLILRYQNRFNYWGMIMSDACGGGNIEIVKLILKKMRTSLDYRHNYINFACEAGHLEIVKLIIDTFGDHEDVHMNWNDGLGAACCGGNIEIVKLMIEKGANDFNDGLVSSCRSDSKYDTEAYIEIIKLMLHYGATSVNEGLKHHMSDNDYVDASLINFLVSAGANNFGCLEEVWQTEDLRLYRLYCKFDGICMLSDPKYLTLLQIFPPYVLFMGSVGFVGVKNNKNFVRKLPVELFRLLFEY